MRRFILVCLVQGLITTGMGLCAQTLVVNPPAVPVGATLSFDFTNTTASTIYISDLGVPYRVFDQAGSLVWGPGYSSDVSIPTVVVPGGSHSMPFNTAATPGTPLRDGHFYVEVDAHPNDVMARFSIGSPSAAASDFLFRLNDGVDMHASSTWAPKLRLTNSASVTRTFNGATWSAVLYGNTLPLGSGSLPSVVLGPGQSVDFAWPSAALLSYPFTTALSLSWLDPASGAATQTIEASGAPSASHENCRVYVPGGSTVPASSALPVFVQSWLHRYCHCGSIVTQYAPNNGFALLFSLGIGYLPLPAGGGAVPLADDAMLQATLMGLRDAYTPGSPGVASGHGGGLPHRGPIGFAQISHPGPVLSGLSFFMSAITWPTVLGSPLAQSWQASVARKITLQ